VGLKRTLKTLSIPISIIIVIIIAVSFILHLNISQTTGIAQVLTGTAQVIVAIVMAIISLAGASGFLLTQKDNITIF
jgi:hypothetical protein